MRRKGHADLNTETAYRLDTEHSFHSLDTERRGNAFLKGKRNEGKRKKIVGLMLWGNGLNETINTAMRVSDRHLRCVSEDPFVCVGGGEYAPPLPYTSLPTIKIGVIL